MSGDLPAWLREIADLYESVADIDPPLIDDAATLRSAADRIAELEANLSALIDAVHLALNYPQERHVYEALMSAYKDGTS